MIFLDGIVDIYAPSLSETAITFNGTQGYFLLLVLILFANVGIWMTAYKYFWPIVKAIIFSNGEEKKYG